METVDHVFLDAVPSQYHCMTNMQSPLKHVCMHVLHKGTFTGANSRNILYYIQTLKERIVKAEMLQVQNVVLQVAHLKRSLKRNSRVHLHSRRGWWDCYGSACRPAFQIVSHSLWSIAWKVENQRKERKKRDWNTQLQLRVGYYSLNGYAVVLNRPNTHTNGNRE